MINLLRSELKKMWFPKSSKLYLLFIVLFSVLVGLLFTFTTELTQKRTLSELRPMSVIEVNILGVDVAAILLIIFIALQIGREFQGKTIQLYLIATPNRTRYLAAKLLVFFLVSFILGMIVACITFVNGQLILLSAHGEMLLSPEVLRFAAGCIIMPVFYALIAVCASFFTRNTAFGIVIPVIILFLPAVARILPLTAQKVVIPILPSSAIHTLMGKVPTESLEYTGVLISSIILIIWCLLSIDLTTWHFRLKDL